MALVLCASLVAGASSVGADDVENLWLARVRLTTEPTVTATCTRLGFVHDDSVKDLRRKIVRVGGDTGLLTFPADDLSEIRAEAFRCAVAPNVPPPAPAPPVTVPPPPTGAPPPPPPGPYR